MDSAKWAALAGPRRGPRGHGSTHAKRACSSRFEVEITGRALRQPSPPRRSARHCTRSRHGARIEVMQNGVDAASLRPPGPAVGVPGGRILRRHELSPQRGRRPLASSGRLADRRSRDTGRSPVARRIQTHATGSGTRNASRTESGSQATSRTCDRTCGRRRSPPRPCSRPVACRTRSSKPSPPVCLRW